MKRKIFIFVFLICVYSILGACASEEGKNVKEPQTDSIELTDVFTTYNNYLMGVLSDPEIDFDPEGLRYTLAFIDKDEVPELIVSERDYHAGGCHIYFYDPKEKQVIATSGEKRMFGENGGFQYYEKMNCIYDLYFTNGTAYLSFYRFEKSGGEYKARKSSTFKMENSDGGTRYYIDSDEVSQGAYETAYELETYEFADLQSVSVNRNDMNGTYETANSDDWLNAFQNMYEDIRY